VPVRDDVVPESAELVAAGYPVGLVCSVLALARSSYYRPDAPAPDETELIRALHEAAEAWPTYGYRRLTVELTRAGQSVNSKRVRRLMAEHHLTAQNPAKRWPPPIAGTPSHAFPISWPTW